MQRDNVNTWECWLGQMRQPFILVSDLMSAFISCIYVVSVEQSTQSVSQAETGIPAQACVDLQ